MIDLRSDTVTRPTEAMRRAMYEAEVGDDVFGDDPTVLALQERVADMVGMQAALFVPSGTQSNLLALMTHCQRGDEYIVGQTAHTYKYEAGGAAVLGSIQPQPIEFEPDGTLCLGTVESYIKPDDCHFARTKLLCLENTTSGQVLPAEYLQDARHFVEKHGLALHLDGARVFNAAVAQGVEVDAITQHFDTVSVCLSKGLGAPVGSVLCGPADFIQEAHKWRKMVGGGMRQAGILAAAGLYALDHHVQRLADDHANASRLADGLQGVPGVQVNMAHTNMAFLTIDPGHLSEFEAYAASEGILVRAAYATRLVTHLDVTSADVETTVNVFRDYFEKGSSMSQDAVETAPEKVESRELKVLYGVFLLSGMSALLYQLAWQRLLFSTYGTNSEAITAIVAAFMLGLGMGSLVGGEASKRYPARLVQMFAGVELAIGLFGAISIPLINGIGQATAGISAMAAGALAFGIVCIPTMLMGATLPILVTHIVGEDHEVGETVGDLYHFNTLGSALVCILASMFIFRFGGLYGAVGLGVIINLAVAAITYFTFRSKG